MFYKRQTNFKNLEQPILITFNLFSLKKNPKVCPQGGRGGLPHFVDPNLNFLLQFNNVQEVLEKIEIE